MRNQEQSPIPDDVRKPYQARKRADRGVKNVIQTHQFQPTVIASGLVCAIGKNQPFTLVRHARAHMWVIWHNDILPKGVRKGRSIVFIGRLRTYNIGNRFDIVSAILLTKKPHAIVSALLDALPPDAIADPELSDDPNQDLGVT